MSIKLLPASNLTLNTFNNNQHVGVLGKHRIASKFCSPAPVGSTTGTPSRRAMGFVLQVSGDDIGLIRIAFGERLPGGDPIGLGITVLPVPKVIHKAIISL